MDGLCSSLLNFEKSYVKFLESQSKTPTQYSFKFTYMSEAVVFNHPKEKAALSSKRALEILHERLRWNGNIAGKTLHFLVIKKNSIRIFYLIVSFR